MAALKSQSNSTSKPIKPLRVQTFRLLYNISNIIQKQNKTKQNKIMNVCIYVCMYENTCSVG